MHGSHKQVSHGWFEVYQTHVFEIRHVCQAADNSFLRWTEDVSSLAIANLVFAKTLGVPCCQGMLWIVIQYMCVSYQVAILCMIWHVLDLQMYMRQNYCQRCHVIYGARSSHDCCAMYLTILSWQGSWIQLPDRCWVQHSSRSLYFLVMTFVIQEIQPIHSGSCKKVCCGIIPFYWQISLNHEKEPWALSIWSERSGHGSHVVLTFKGTSTQLALHRFVGCCVFRSLSEDKFGATDSESHLCRCCHGCWEGWDQWWCSLRASSSRCASLYWQESSILLACQRQSSWIMDSLPAFNIDSYWSCLCVPGEASLLTDNVPGCENRTCGFRAQVSFPFHCFALP